MGTSLKLIWFNDTQVPVEMTDGVTQLLEVCNVKAQQEQHCACHLISTLTLDWTPWRVRKQGTAGVSLQEIVT